MARAVTQTLGFFYRCPAPHHPVPLTTTTTIPPRSRTRASQQTQRQATLCSFPAHGKPGFATTVKHGTMATVNATGLVFIQKDGSCPQPKFSDKKPETLKPEETNDELLTVPAQQSAGTSTPHSKQSSSGTTSKWGWMQLDKNHTVHPNGLCRPQESGCAETHDATKMYLSKQRVSHIRLLSTGITTHSQLPGPLVPFLLKHQIL